MQIKCDSCISYETLIQAQLDRPIFSRQLEHIYSWFLLQQNAKANFSYSSRVMKEHMQSQLELFHTASNTMSP